ncbi:MAG: hypothetical protein AB3N28_02050 [Kordiimonas sp.]
MPIDKSQTDYEVPQKHADMSWGSAAKYLGWFIAALVTFTSLEALAYGLADAFMTSYAPFSYLLPHGLALALFYKFAGPRGLMAMACLASIMAISGTFSSDLRGLVSGGIAIAALACWLKVR